MLTETQLTMMEDRAATQPQGWSSLAIEQLVTEVRRLRRMLAPPVAKESLRRRPQYQPLAEGAD